MKSRQRACVTNLIEQDIGVVVLGGENAEFLLQHRSEELQLFVGLWGGSERVNSLTQNSLLKQAQGEVLYRRDTIIERSMLEK